MTRLSRLGRNIVTLRLQTLLDLGLVTESGRDHARGGRSAGVWEFTGEVGHILVGIFGHSSLRVALGDLNLNVLESRRIPWELTVDPAETCAR
ncbi:MAG: hypothetical protein IH629_03440, partial [Thermoleophilia bacterium]|nr:hypothetical protein [Thermoleophilia bacterium]